MRATFSRIIHHRGGIEMFKLSMVPLFMCLLFLASALAQDAAPQGTADQKEKKFPGINTVVIVTDTKTDEAQENITQKVNVIYDDYIAAQATSVRSGRSTFGPYRILNLKVEKALYRADTHTVLLFTDLNNITNRQYLMPWQFRDPGFNVMGGLDFGF
jgi:hypothetical protein